MSAEAIEKNLALRRAFGGMSRPWHIGGGYQPTLHLALMMLKIAKDGEQDAFAVKHRAVDIMRQSRL